MLAPTALPTFTAVAVNSQAHVVPWNADSLTAGAPAGSKVIVEELPDDQKSNRTVGTISQLRQFRNQLRARAQAHMARVSAEVEQLMHDEEQARRDAIKVAQAGRRSTADRFLDTSAVYVTELPDTGASISLDILKRVHHTQRQSEGNREEKSIDSANADHTDELQAKSASGAAAPGHAQAKGASGAGLSGQTKAEDVDPRQSHSHSHSNGDEDGTCDSKTDTQDDGESSETERTSGDEGGVDAKEQGNGDANVGGDDMCDDQLGTSSVSAAQVEEVSVTDHASPKQNQRQQLPLDQTTQEDDASIASDASSTTRQTRSATRRLRAARRLRRSKRHALLASEPY